MRMASFKADPVQGAVMPGQDFGQDEEQSHGAQKNGDAGRFPEDGFGLLFEQQPGQGPGNRGDDDKEEHLALGAVVPGGRDKGVEHVQPVLVEIGHQGHQGADVEEDVKAQAGLGHLQVVLQEGQVAGAGNGQEFGNTLDDAEQEGHKGVHNGGMYHGDN